MERSEPVNTISEKATKIVLELNDVWKIYHLDAVEVQAVRGISMKINEGEFVAVMGASGSGKSTTLSLMGALDSPTRGTIILDGVDISKFSEGQVARLRGKKIGFVFQLFNLYPNLDIFENIALPMRIHEFPEEQIQKKVPELIKLVGLEHRIGHLPTQLSGGERQRVAIARALSTDPAILLADEPTGNLDTKAGHEIMQFLTTLHSQGKTIVMVTHEPDIADFAQRKIILKDGKIISDSKMSPINRRE